MPSPFNYLFSGHLTQAREQKNYSQEYVAAAVGISPREYQRYEKGLSQPRAETFLRLISFLDMDIQELP